MTSKPSPCDRISHTKFKKIDQSPISNLNEYVSSRCGDNMEIFVGTDSKVSSRNITFVTAICFYKKKNGCHVIYAKYTMENKKISLDQRLWEEVEMTRCVADKVREYINNKAKMYVDIDLNPNKIHNSNRIYNPAKGYLESLGYDVRGKGEVIPSIYAANFLCQNK